MQPHASREVIQRMVNNLTPFGIFCILDTSVLFCLLLAESRITWQLHTNTQCKMQEQWNLVSSQIKLPPHCCNIETNWWQCHRLCCSKCRIETDFSVRPVKKGKQAFFPFSASQDCKICLGRKYSKAQDEQRQLLFQNEQGSSKVTFSFSQWAWGCRARYQKGSPVDEVIGQASQLHTSKDPNCREMGSQDDTCGLW